MHEFDTPEPITAVIELMVSDVRISASDRPDTVVEIRPSDPESKADVTAVDHVRVDYSGGTLLVKATGRWRSWSPFGYGGSVEAHISLPTGSQIKGTSVGAFRCTGPLGDCQIKTSLGDIHIEQAGAATLSTSVGDIALERAAGDAEVTSGSGEIRVGGIDGTADIKASNGDTHVGSVAGDLRVKGANGDIAVERVDGSVTVKTANGDIRVGSVRTGSVTAETQFGAVEIGIAEGVAAWLDLHTGYGQLRNTLEATGAPGPDDDRVEVRARSGYGDITIRRSHAAARGRPTPATDPLGDTE